MEVIIERAKPEDAEAILRLKKAAWLQTYVRDEHGVTAGDMDKKFTEADILAATPHWQNGIAHETETSEKLTFVARSDEKVVGFTSPNLDDGQWRLGALYVAPDAQSQGVGAMLLERALAWLGPDKDVYIHVVSYNDKAIRFYEKHGFKKTGVETPEEFDEEKGIKLLPEIEMVLPVQK